MNLLESLLNPSLFEDSENLNAILKKLSESKWNKEAFKNKLQESEWDETKSGLYQHALTELKLSGLTEKDSDYEGMLAEAVLEIVKIFAKQGHSGFSAGMTIEVLEKLLRYENLTPITDDPEEWMDVAEMCADRGSGVWQCKRNPSLFSTDGGKTYYNVDNHTEIVQSERKVK